MKTESKLRKILRSKEFTLVILLIAIMGFFWWRSPMHSYLWGSNITAILNAMALFGLLAIGEALLIVFGEIDLSPGFIGTCAGAFMAALLSKTVIPWYGVIVLCLALGIAFGLLNAFLINEFKFQGFIATLAVGSFIAKGLSYIIGQGKAVKISDAAITFIGTEKVGGVVPYTIFIALALILIYGIILAKTKFGRSIYLAGGNRQAARYTGISPKKLSYILFANSGMLGALAGMLYDARLKSGNLDGTNHYAFPAMTAAILGGISFGGGSGNMLGCFLGLVIISAFNNGLAVLAVSSFWRDVASGLLLILALLLDWFTNRNFKKRGA